MYHNITDEEKQQVVDLFINDNLTHQQIADKLNINKRTVGNILKENNVYSNHNILPDIVIERIQQRYNQVKNLEKVAKEFHISKRKIQPYIQLFEKDTFDQKDYRAHKKEQLIEYKGGKCEICGYDRCKKALEFHHVDVYKKLFTISSSLGKRIEVLKQEVDKCVLACANCHREIHEGLIDIKKLNQILIDDIKTHESKEQKDSNIIYCAKCGVIEVKNEGNLCEVCQYKEQSKRTRDIDRETLKNLIRTTSFVQIGKMYDVSDNAVRKWCDKFNLPRLSKEIKTYTDEEWKSI